ncbi:MAG TPA: helix-turn-helix transcriptional regulator [Cryomorphaceae bacterium]|nr:helix-turn-helix transcriptional regulator [Cryomorphaceae bacterium]
MFTFVSVEIKDRIAAVIKVNQHTASSFAETLGVQRSSVSHVLNGRNKPSIDFIQKMLEKFPRVDAGWLITGKDPSPTAAKEESPTKLPIEKLKSGKSPSLEKKEIEKIVVFFTDNTFESYEQGT